MPAQHARHINWPSGFPGIGIIDRHHDPSRARSRLPQARAARRPQSQGPAAGRWGSARAPDSFDTFQHLCWLGYRARSPRCARSARRRGHCASAPPPAKSACSPHALLPPGPPPGEPYDATDPELTDDRIRCRKLLRQFNQELEYDDVEGRAAVLRQLLGSLDEGGCQGPQQPCDNSRQGARVLDRRRRLP